MYLVDVNVSIDISVSISWTVFFRPSVFWLLKIKDKINAYYLATDAKKICS